MYALKRSARDNYSSTDLADFVLGVAYNMTQLKSHRRQQKARTPMDVREEMRQRDDDIDSEVPHNSKRTRLEVNDAELEATQIIPPEELAPQYSTAPVVQQRKKKTYDMVNVRRSSRNN